MLFVFFDDIRAECCMKQRENQSLGCTRQPGKRPAPAGTSFPEPVS